MWQFSTLLYNMLFYRDTKNCLISHFTSLVQNTTCRRRWLNLCALYSYFFVFNEIFQVTVTVCLYRKTPASSMPNSFIIITQTTYRFLVSNNDFTVWSNKFLIKHWLLNHKFIWSSGIKLSKMCHNCSATPEILRSFEPSSDCFWCRQLFVAQFFRFESLPIIGGW